MSQINSYAKSNKNSLCENLLAKVVLQPRAQKCCESSERGRHLPGGLNI